MKQCIFLSFLLLPFSLLAQWTKTSGPVETSGTTIEIAGSNYYLGTNGTGLFTSTDKGANWSKVAAYPDSATSLSISKIIYHANMIYVANSKRIYVSADNGVSFQYGGVGLPDTLTNYNLFNANGNLYATAQLTDPITFNTITNLYYYNDFTLQWQQTYPVPHGYTITSVAALHDTLYCATYGHGIYTTHNNGFIWDSINTGNGILGTNNIRLLATYGQKLYAISYDNGTPGLYITSSGFTWTSTILNFTGGNIITTIAAYKDTICLGSPGAIYISPNAGSAWRTTVLPYYSINEAKFTGHGIIAADLASGFIYTPNDSNWQSSNKGLNYSSTSHLAYAYTKLYAMDAYNTFHTTNRGNNWTPDTNRLFNMSAIARMGNKMIGISKYGQNDLYSFDQGQTWGFENTPGVGILVSKCIVDNVNRQIYAWGQSDVRRSDDYGKTWKSLFYPLTYTVHDTLFTSMAKINNRLFLTWTDPVARLFYSDDSGNHWQQIITGDAIYHVEAVGNTLLISTNNGVKKSTNLGGTFTLVYGGDLFSTYVNGNTLFNYSGPYQNSIQYSTNYGATWTDISPIIDSIGSINDLIMDDTYLYAATNRHSVWRRSLADIGIAYTPDTSNNYIVNVGVQLIANNDKPLITVYPNPFHNQFNISLTTSAPHFTSIKVYDATGRCVQVIADGNMEMGQHTFTGNSDLAPGFYFVTVSLDGSMYTQKVVCR